MKVKVEKNRVRGIGRVFVTVHDAKDEEFKCELPWHLIIVAKYMKPLLSPDGKEIRSDDIPKVCTRLESDYEFGDLYLVPAGFKWK